MKEFLQKEYNLDEAVPEELIRNFLDSIYVEKGEIDNLIKLKVNLKTGQEVPVYYRKDLSLSLATHVGGDKLKFKLPRIKNNQKAPDLCVEVEDITLCIAV